MPARTDYRPIEASYAQAALFASLMAPVIAVVGFCGRLGFADDLGRGGSAKPRPAKSDNGNDGGRRREAKSATCVHRRLDRAVVGASRHERKPPRGRCSSCETVWRSTRR